MASAGLSRSAAAGPLNGQAVAPAQAELALGGESRLLAAGVEDCVVARLPPLATSTSIVG